MYIISKVLSRLNIIVILLVIQIIAISYILSLIINYAQVIIYIGIAVSVVSILFIIKRDDASAYKTTWLIIIFTFPIFGGLIYALIGNKKHTYKINKYMEEHSIVANLLDSDGPLSFIKNIKNKRMLGLIRYIRDGSSYHMYDNTSVKYYTMGQFMYDDMLGDIKNAKRFIFLEYFIIYKSEMWETILNILEIKAKEGLDIRLIVDDFGCQKLFTNRYIRKLRNSGIKVLRFNPMTPFLLMFMNNRDHRKILVTDGTVAYNGGINISDEYINKTNPYGNWKDTGVRLEGSGAWSFTLSFIEMWDTFCKKHERIDNHIDYKAEQNKNIKGDGYILPFADNPLDDDQLGENIYVDILNQSKNYVYIFTPYLIISEKMIHAIQMAAKRGVDVKIVTPGIPDKKVIHRLTRSYYSILLKHGVKIYEYTPGFLHAKSFICDDEISVVGTINLDFRSLYLHFECGVLLYDALVIKEIKEDFNNTISFSRQITLDTKKRKMFYNELIDAFLHMFAPLM